MTIDSINTATMWNMGLLKGSYGSLLKYPKRKEVKYANYAERDGITPDLRKFEIEPRQVSLIFFIRHSSENEFRSIYDDFFMTVNDYGYHTFDLENGLTYQFRYDKTQSFKSIKLFNAAGGTSFTMNFIEDETSINNAVIIPTGGIDLKGMYIVDGVDFGDFGVHPHGSIGEALKYPDAKDAFTDGQTYSLNTRRIKHKEVTIPFWLHANSRVEFIHNYQAFYNAFAKTGTRLLYIKEIDVATSCYYQDCTSFNVTWNETPTATFSIKLCIPVVTWLSGITNI